MKISIRAGVRVKKGSDVHPLKWAFERGSELGFDGLQLSMGNNRFSFVSGWTQERREGARDLCAEYDMPIFSLTSDWAWGYSTFFPQIKDWGPGVEWLGEDAKLAKDLGAHTILMHFAMSKGSWNDLKAALKDVAAMGEEYGVRFGYEVNVWQHLGVGGLAELLRMVEEVGSPSFGVYLHNDYPRRGLELQDQLNMVGDRLVQTMDSSRLVNAKVEIDFEKAFAAMKQHFSDGVYNFEINWETAAENKQAIDELITKYW